MESTGPLRVYLAGELFSIKHLQGNVCFGETLFELSKGKYVCVIPQNLEQRETTARAIRDQDLRTVIASDVAVFHYDGTELDSGTVVEYLFAKFADIPAVLLRTDFRAGGDQNGYPWNLMTSYFPRTEVVLFDSLSVYQGCLPSDRTNAEELLKTKAGSTAAIQATKIIAQKVLDALNNVVGTPSILPKQSAEHIYHWLATMPGFPEADKDAKRFLELMWVKQSRGLLG